MIFILSRLTDYYWKQHKWRYHYANDATTTTTELTTATITTFSSYLYMDSPSHAPSAVPAVVIDSHNGYMFTMSMLLLFLPLTTSSMARQVSEKVPKHRNCATARLNP